MCAIPRCVQEKVRWTVNMWMREKWQICYMSLSYCRLGCEIIQTLRSMSNLKPDGPVQCSSLQTLTLFVVALVNDTGSLHSHQPLHCSVSSVKRNCDCDLKNYTEFFNPIFICDSWETVLHVKFINITRSRQRDVRCSEYMCVFVQPRSS